MQSVEKGSPVGSLFLVFELEIDIPQLEAVNYNGTGARCEQNRRELPVTAVPKRSKRGKHFCPEGWHFPHVS
jgi:hypothetical protein